MVEAPSELMVQGSYSGYMNVEINTFYVEINMLNMEPLKYRRERRNHCEGLQSNAESED